MIRRVLITHGYSLEQKGDSALLTVTIREVRRAFPGARVTAQIMERTRRGQRYAGAGVMSSPIYLIVGTGRGRIIKFAKLFYVLTISLLWAVLARWDIGADWLLRFSFRDSLAAIRDADVIVPTAGGYIAGEPGFFPTVSLITILTPLWIAIILRKDILHFSQSIGPLGSRFQHRLVRRTLRHATLIITRESISYDFVLGMGIDPARVVASTDAAFLFKARRPMDIRRRYGITARTVVGITTKVHLSPKKQARYEDEMVRFVDWLTARPGMFALFIPQITSSELNEDDRIINNRLHKRLARPERALSVTDSLSNEETKALINDLDYTVGTRFHSVIFSLTGRVPAIAIEYEHKSSGIMTDLGLRKWVVAMDGLQSRRLIKLFQELQQGRTAYLTQLDSMAPEFQKRARRATTALKTYARATGTRTSRRR